MYKRKQIEMYLNYVEYEITSLKYYFNLGLRPRFLTSPVMCESRIFSPENYKVLYLLQLY